MRSVSFITVAPICQLFRQPKKALCNRPDLHMPRPIRAAKDQQNCSNCTKPSDDQTQSDDAF